ncbi:hypothetical protein EKG37_09810 [Robertmurraya yapensis]|uniref:Uncharacterized protein n=1 Tax=Bacillus yapensis TaxID=2492960 RepID=A0A3S0RN08_9BACI|nr:hypothetical protein EKG37_09810 [Bacillus yapensis]TKS96643.1 hypothetical protein FAR12_09810 [Bacillus yapensis]
MEWRGLDSWGICRTGEIPQERQRRGSSPPAPRKASAWSGNQRVLTIIPFKNAKDTKRETSQCLLSTV